MLREWLPHFIFTIRDPNADYAFGPVLFREEWTLDYILGFVHALEMTGYKRVDAKYNEQSMHLIFEKVTP